MTPTKSVYEVTVRYSKDGGDYDSKMHVLAVSFEEALKKAPSGISQAKDVKAEIIGITLFTSIDVE